MNTLSLCDLSSGFKPQVTTFSRSDRYLYLTKIEKRNDYTVHITLLSVNVELFIRKQYQCTTVMAPEVNCNPVNWITSMLCYFVRTMLRVDNINKIYELPMNFSVLLRYPLQYCFKITSWKKLCVIKCEGNLIMQCGWELGASERDSALEVSGGWLEI